MCARLKVSRQERLELFAEVVRRGRGGGAGRGRGRQRLVDALVQQRAVDLVQIQLRQPRRHQRRLRWIDCGS